MPRLRTAILTFTLAALAARALAGADDVMRVGPGVTPPRLLHKVDPEYSPEARASHVQGKRALTDRCR